MKRGLQEALRQYYVLTDRRAMTVRPDGDVSAMELEHMGECRLYPEGDAVSLALGSGLLEERDKQLRWRANHPMTGSDSRGAPSGGKRENVKLPAPSHGRHGESITLTNF